MDDLERRINPLFDALNCETVSRGVVDQLVILTRGGYFLFSFLFLKRDIDDFFFFFFFSLSDGCPR